MDESPACFISNMGRIYRMETYVKTTCGRYNREHMIRMIPKILECKKLSQKGYPRVNLKNKVVFVHRLVGKYFIPNPLNKPQINHIDGVKTNNHASNLEWVTNQENRDHAVKTGLHGAKKRSYDEELVKKHYGKLKQIEIANLLGVSQQTISKAAIRLGLDRSKRLFSRVKNILT